MTPADAPRHRSPLDRQPGFILAATLWIVAVLALVAVYVTGWVGDSIARGYVRQARVEALRKAEEARATTLYWLATRFISPRGVELLSAGELARAGAASTAFSAPIRGKTYLALDDRPYGFGGATLHLQEARGLFNLDTGSDADLESLLGAYGVPLAERDPLVAKLRDYTDPSPYKRLNGAKAREYQAVGLQPPTGEKLRTPWELRRVLDWTRIDPLGFGRSGFYEQVTTVTATGLNPNTAPAPILALLPGVNDAAVARIIAARQRQPFLGPADFEAESGVTLPLRDLAYFFLPLNSVRISITVPDDPLEHVSAIHMTPGAAEQPWQIDYVFDVPPFPDHRLRDSSATPELPDPTRPPTSP
jgi:DNA uptake protein ComE-like DNA-binding protein